MRMPAVREADDGEDAVVGAIVRYLPGEGSTEQRSEQIVVANWELHVDVGMGDPIALRGSAGARGAAIDVDSQVAGRGELVEVVTGNVGVQGDCAGHF